ncbi:hypothetical protein ACQZ4X_04685 [Agrobacterium vitis]
MFTFADLLSRAPLDELRNLAGPSAVELLDAEFPKAVNQEGLAALIIGQHTLAGALGSDAIRMVALNELHAEEAVQICKALGVPHLDPPATLRKLDLQFNLVHAERFFGFFGAPFFRGSPAPVDATRRAGPKERLAEHVQQNQVYRELRRRLADRTADVVVQMPFGAGKLRAVSTAVLDLMRSEQDEEVLLWLSRGHRLCEETFVELFDRWKEDGTRDLTMYRLFGNGADADERFPNLTSLRSSIVVADLHTFLNGYRALVAQFPDLRATFGRKIRGVVLHDATSSFAPDVSSFLDDFKASGGGNIVGITSGPGSWFNEVGMVGPLKQRYQGGVVSAFAAEPLDSAQPKLPKVDFKVLPTAPTDVQLDGLDVAVGSMEALAGDKARSLLLLNTIVAEVKAGRGVIFYAATAQQARTFVGVLLYHTVFAGLVTSEMPLQVQAQQIASFQTREQDKVLCVHGVMVAGNEIPKATTAIFSMPVASFDQFAGIISRFAVDRQDSDVKVIIVDDGFKIFTAMPPYFGKWDKLEFADDT